MLIALFKSTLCLPTLLPIFSNKSNQTIQNVIGRQYKRQLQNVFLGLNHYIKNTFKEMGKYIYGAQKTVV